MNRKKTILIFNSEVKKLLQQKGISLQDGLSYLVCLYYDMSPTYVPSTLETKILSANIVTKDYSSGTFKWKVPLFEEQETGFEWVKEWMDLFKSVNPERRGVKADVLRRMKKFFANNPTYRKDDVFKATQNYLSSVDHPKFCKKSHKFIYEQDGSSMLLDFCSKVEEVDKQTKNYNDDVI